MPALNLYRIFSLGKQFVADRRGMTSIETATMFGVFAIGFALIASNILDNSDKTIASSGGLFTQQIDNVVTGSISRPSRYIIRKSVLQPSKTSRCIILSDGRQLGEC